MTAHLPQNALYASAAAVGKIVHGAIRRERDVVYANGSATFHGNGVFMGTIAGRTGTASYRYEGVFPVGSPSFHANWVLIGKTGELASANGQGTFGGTFGEIIVTRIARL